MRILFVADAASIHTIRWAEYFRDSGSDVHIASYRPQNINGVSVHVMPKFMLGKLGYLFGALILKRLFIDIRPDIVHAHHITSYGVISAIACIKPLILTAWGSDVLLAPKESRLIRIITSYALKKADTVTTVAEHMNKSIDQLNVGVKNIQVIPFGIDTDLFKCVARERKGNEKVKIICTRNFSPIYDVATLIKAIYMLKRRNIILETSLVGDGPLKDELKKMVTQLNLNEDINFLGYIENKNLPKSLAESDIFVSPSLSDGNNVSLTEAMSCGCFPVATDIPANSQWITHGHNGFLYQPGNAEALADSIERAVKDRDFIDNLRLINRHIIEDRADWIKCTKNMESLYLSVMQNFKTGLN